MAPITRTETLYQKQTNDDQQFKKTEDQWNCFDHILWFNVFWFTALHVFAFYGLYLSFTEAKLLTIVYAIFLYHISLFGITAGVHRLWSHRAFKAVLPFRIFVALCNSMAYQNSVYVWGRDHRVHHKYTETTADPVSSARGFFFSHCGWLLCKKHPDVTTIGGKVDCSDMMADPVVYYQHKYYIISMLVMCVAIPTLVPWHYWSESLWNAFFVAVMLRYILALNSTWFVNSAAHMWGYRPYDVNMAPVENLAVSALTLGEGYHNYHHSFPFDYSTSEWGWNINLTTFVLDCLAKVGIVYDRKFATKAMIEQRKSRTGPKSEVYEAQEHTFW